MQWCSSSKACIAAEQCSEELILNGSATYSSDTHKCRCDEKSKSSDVFVEAVKVVDQWTPRKLVALNYTDFGMLRIRIIFSKIPDNL